jgi:TPR repeat protein
LNLAARLATGDGIRQNPARAARIYRGLANDGSGEAAFNLATMYARGEGVRTSWRVAVRLMWEAEELGSSDASMLLGELTLKGASLLKRSTDRAFLHFALATARHDVRGLDRMSEMISRAPKMSASRIAKNLSTASMLIRDPVLLRKFQRRGNK